MKIQYVVFMLIMFSFFVIISLVLLPFAFLQSLMRKLQQIFKAKTNLQQIGKIVYFITFTILGLPIMLLTFLADCWYFWEDNFRSKLKKIVIERDPSTINKNSIIKMKMLCEKYSHSRCKAIYTVDYVKRMREERDIGSLLQFLIFG